MLLQIKKWTKEGVQQSCNAVCNQILDARSVTRRKFPCWGPGAYLWEEGWVIYHPPGIINVEGAENAAGKHILNEEKLVFCTQQILRDWDEYKAVCDFLLKFIISAREWPLWLIAPGAKLLAAPLLKKLSFWVNFEPVFSVNVNWYTILGAFAELRKVTVSFMSVCPHGTTRLPLDRFWLNLLFELFFFFFENMSRKFKNNGYFTWRSFDIFDNISLNSS